MKASQAFSNILVQLINIDNAMNEEKHATAHELIDRLWDTVSDLEDQATRLEWIEALGDQNKQEVSDEI